MVGGDWSGLKGFCIRGPAAFLFPSGLIHSNNGLSHLFYLFTAGHVEDTCVYIHEGRAHANPHMHNRCFSSRRNTLLSVLSVQERRIRVCAYGPSGRRIFTLGLFVYYQMILQPQ